MAAPRGLALKLDDQAADGWLSHIDIDVPELKLRGLVPREGNSDEYLEVVGVSGGLALSVGNTAQNWQEKEAAQKAFVQFQDLPTSRCCFLYNTKANPGSGKDQLEMFV